MRTGWCSFDSPVPRQSAHDSVQVSPRPPQCGQVTRTGTFTETTRPANVPVRVTCPHCGGRGETWTESCALCRGTGESKLHHPVRITVPPRVADGAKFRFRIKSPGASPVRVELRVAIRSSAA